jgi:hypothetical protein
LGGAALASLLAGSVAGAIGVGVAFPLDTLKTKAQVLGPKKTSGMLQTVHLIWNTEGLAGFFGKLALRLCYARRGCGWSVLISQSSLLFSPSP